MKLNEAWVKTETERKKANSIIWLYKGTLSNTHKLKNGIENEIQPRNLKYIQRKSKTEIRHNREKQTHVREREREREREKEREKDGENFRVEQ